MDQINVVGGKLFHVIMNVGYWVTLIAGAGQVINSISKKDAQNAMKQAFTYGTAFGSLYLIKWLLDMIKAAFA